MVIHDACSVPLRLDTGARGRNAAAWLTSEEYRRIPWTPQLTAYLQSHFVPVIEGPEWLYVRTAHP